MRVGPDLAAEQQQLSQEEPRCRAGLEGGPGGSGQIFTGAEHRLPSTPTATPWSGMGLAPWRAPWGQHFYRCPRGCPTGDWEGARGSVVLGRDSVGSWVAVWDEVVRVGECVLFHPEGHTDFHCPSIPSPWP